MADPIELEYIYFVSYSHSAGTGWLEIVHDQPIKNGDQLRAIQDAIAHNTAIMRPVVLNFVLLDRRKKQ